MIKRVYAKIRRGMWGWYVRFNDWQRVKRYEYKKRRNPSLLNNEITLDVHGTKHW